MRLRIVLGLIIILGFVLPMTTESCLVIAQSTDTPEIRMSHAMVFDAYNEVVVMFGGSTNVGGYHSLGDTWTYSYELNTWNELTLTTSPPARAMHNMVFCDATNEIILYGGWSYLDTWSFDCTTQTWSQVITEENPGVHYNLGLAYDLQENVVVLFGGFGDDGLERDDTWIFNCTSREWSEVFPVDQPLERYGLVMAYDDTIQKIVMTCGNSPQGHLDDTWWYDVSENTWEEQTTTGTRYGLKWPSMVFDSSIQRCILFGGQIGDDPVDHTWSYDATENAWERHYPNESPPGRITGAFAFDSKSNASILFGGGGEDYNPLGDTWAYSYEDNNWVDMSGIEATTTSSSSTITPPPESIRLEIIVVAIAIPLIAVVIVLLMIKRK